MTKLFRFFIPFWRLFELPFNSPVFTYSVSFVVIIFRDCDELIFKYADRRGNRFFAVVQNNDTCVSQKVFGAFGKSA